MKDDELLKYYYEELIMSLITMSLPAEKQREMIGFGCVGDEILEDFDSFYCMRRQVYINHMVFSEKQLQRLDDFHKYLDKFNNQSEDFYWDIEELKNNPLWEELRVESKKILKNVFGKKYRIDLQRRHTYLDGKTIEHTKRVLIELDDNNLQEAKNA